MNTFHLSFMEHNDTQEAAKVLSMAMLNNPMHVAVFQNNGESARLQIEQMFVELFSERPGIVYLAKEDNKIIGVMRMSSCVGKTTEKQPGERKGEHGPHDRKFIWFKEWAKRDLKKQHWHLGPIGVLPSHRRLGVGTQLMERFCNEVDHCSATAYLETDLDENVLFYRKFGFNVVSKSDIFDINNRYMVRNPPPA